MCRGRLVRHARALACVRQQRRGVRAWLEGLEAERVAWQTANALRHASVRRAFNSWCGRGVEVERDLAMYAFRYRHAAAIRHYGVHRAWSSWTAFWRSHAHATTRLVNALGDWMGKGMRRGWFTWYVIHRRRQAFIRCAANLLRHQLARGYRKWSSVSSAAGHALASLRWGLSCVCQLRARRALSTWIDAIECQEATMAIRSLVYRTAQAMRMQNVSLAFRTWATTAANLVRAVQSLRTVLDQLMGRGAGRAWNKWAAVAKSASRVYRHATVMRMRRERMAMGCWAERSAAVGRLRRYAPHKPT